MNSPVPAMPPASPVPPSIEEGKKKRGGSSFNQLIAKTHRLNNQLIGLQLTMGNIIAVCLSAAQITAGVVMLLWITIGWPAIFATTICFPLAVVIERLSLGGLMILRTAGKELDKVEHDYYSMLMEQEREPTEREKFEFKRLTKRLNKNRFLAVPIIFIGIFISGAVGDQFWGKVFLPLGGWQTITLSLSCAVAISLTFVFSELYKELADDGLVDLVQDSRVARAVLANEETDIQIDLTMQAFANFRSDHKKNNREVGKIERVIGGRVTAFADFVEQKGLGSVQEVNDTSQQKFLPPKAESKAKFEDCKADLEWLLQRNPGISYSAIANKFGVSKSTAKSWCDRLNA